MKTSNRTKSVILRVTEWEKEALERKAHEAGYSVVANYLRDELKLLDDIKPQPGKIKLTSNYKMSTQVHIRLTPKLQMKLQEMRSAYGDLNTTDLITIAIQQHKIPAIHREIQGNSREVLDFEALDRLLKQ